MYQAVQAIYENGVFRPIQPIDLPEPGEVELEVQQIRHEPNMPLLDWHIYCLISRAHLAAAKLAAKLKMLGGETYKLHLSGERAFG